VGIWKYIKAAFSNHWNLLAVAGGIGFSVLSGRPEVGLPLLAAMELAWLGIVGTHSKFRQFIDIQEHQQLKADDARTAEIRMRRMLTSLPRGAQRRFELLMSQCEEMRNITQQYQAAHGAEEPDSMFTEVRVDGLDRLLWLFLKLLYTENSLNRFFETTTIDAIERELRQVKARIERERSRPANRQRERIMATLEDNRQTCDQRRKNFEQARDSYELVRAEQKRLENKIRSITETGISKGDPGLLSTEVDTVAGSIRETEKTLSELQFVTGFSTFENEAVPEIVNRKVVAG